MRLPRLTTRRLMVLVAAAALLLALIVIKGRQRHYRTLATEYARREQLGRAMQKWEVIQTEQIDVTVRIEEGTTALEVNTADVESYTRLRAKYERAARYPWLPVPPDPPLPK